MIEAAILWIVLGGFMEPVWVISLKRYNETKSIQWAALAVVFMIASPMCLSFAMTTMPVGISYAIWTGLGAVFTLIAGALVFHDRIDRVKVMLVFLIIIGIAGLQMTMGAGA